MCWWYNSAHQSLKLLPDWNPSKITDNIFKRRIISIFNMIFQALLHLRTNATAQFVQKHPTLQRFFFPLQKRVYSANSGDVFSFTLSHPAAERHQGQWNQTCGRQQPSVMSKQNPWLSRNWAPESTVSRLNVLSLFLFHTHTHTRTSNITRTFIDTMNSISSLILTIPTKPLTLT